MLEFVDRTWSLRLITTIQHDYREASFVMTLTLHSGRTANWLIGLTLGLAGTVTAGELTDSLKVGKAELKSAGALTFGPEGVLFVGDTRAGSIWAIATKDAAPAAGMNAVDVDNLGKKAADRLGIPATDVMINDLAINPASGLVYLSVSRGKGPDAQPVIFRIEKDKLEELNLDSIAHAKVDLPALPDSSKVERGQSLRNDSITDLAYLDGKLYVAGLSNEEFSSRMVTLDVPFKPAGQGASVEIYHGAHGRYETKSPIRTFVTYRIQGQPHLLAAYTCTPLVKLPVKDVTKGGHVKGTTVAELGNRNRPLDMIVYTRDGRDYILMANSARGVMKIPTEGLADRGAITEPVRGGGVAGQPYETVESLKGVDHLDKLDDARAVILTRTEAGQIDLKTIPTP